MVKEDVADCINGCNNIRHSTCSSYNMRLTLLLWRSIWADLKCRLTPKPDHRREDSFCLALLVCLLLELSHHTMRMPKRLQRGPQGEEFKTPADTAELPADNLYPLTSHVTVPSWKWTFQSPVEPSHLLPHGTEKGWSC